MARPITRRTALTGLAAATASLAASVNPFATRPASAQGAVIKVTHFGGPYQVLQQVAADPFAKAGLGRVEYEVETTASALAKIQSQKANPPFDVVMMSRATTYRAGRAGLVMPLSRSDFPAMAQAIPTTHGPGGFGVGFVLDTLGIMFDKRQVSQPLTSWMDFWRPELRGKIVLPSASVTLSAYFLICVAHTLGNGKVDDASIDEAFKRIAELKPHVRTFYNDPIQASQLVERGDIAVAPQLSIRIGNTMRNSPTVGRSMPKEGGPSLPFDLSIPVNATNVAGAKKYIEFILGEEAQSGLASQLLATPMRNGIGVPAELQPLMLLDTKLIWATDEDYVATNFRDWQNRWTRTIQA
jgi:putative spermidine/putrescine transport system substrate-binding protein